MLETSSAELDHSVFQRGNESEFGLLIGFAAQMLEQSNEVVLVYEGFDPQATGEGIAREIEHEGGEVAEAYERLSDMVGENFMAGIVGDLGGLLGDERPSISDEDYQKARTRKQEAETTLVDYTVGYHDFMKENLVRAYEEDSDEIDEEAWMATWKRLKDTLGGSEGTLLAEVASFFDGQIRKEFGDKYKPIEEDRGPVVSQDIRAKTFYIVMKEHLHRAIIGANRDEWTGYK